MENGWRCLGAGKILSHLQSVLADASIFLCCLPAWIFDQSGHWNPGMASLVMTKGEYRLRKLKAQWTS